MQSKDLLVLNVNDTGHSISRLGLIRWLFEHRAILDQLYGSVDRFLDIDEPVDSFEGFKARVKIALELSEKLADLSETQADDNLVAWVAAILINDALLALLAGLLHRAMDGDSIDALLAESPEGVNALAVNAFKADLEAAGIPWVDVVKYAPYVMELLKLLMSLRR